MATYRVPQFIAKTSMKVPHAPYWLDCQTVYQDLKSDTSRTSRPTEFSSVSLVKKLSWEVAKIWRGKRKIRAESEVMLVHSHQKIHFYIFNKTYSRIELGADFTVTLYSGIDSATRLMLLFLFYCRRIHLLKWKRTCDARVWYSFVYHWFTVRFRSAFGWKKNLFSPKKYVFFLRVALNGFNNL